MVTNILVEVLASIAEQERQTIRRRQREGIDVAKKRGKKFGRHRKEVEDWDNVYYRWSQKKITAQKAASILKIFRTQFYKLVQEEREEKRGVLAKMIGSRVDICENECGYASDGILAIW